MDNANFPYGIELAERAIQICEGQHQEQSYAYTKAKMDLISANVALGDFYAAGEIAKGLDLTRYSGADYLSDIIRSVGLVYLELGFYDEMIALSNKVINTKNVDRLSKIIAFEVLLVYHERKGEIEKAEYDLDRVKELIDDIINPSNYMEALICQNYGWIRQNLDDSDTAERFILSAITFYEANEFSESIEYITAKYNLSLVYASQHRYGDYLRIKQRFNDAVKASKPNMEQLINNYTEFAVTSFENSIKTEDDLVDFLVINIPNFLDTLKLPTTNL